MEKDWHHHRTRAFNKVENPASPLTRYQTIQVSLGPFNGYKWYYLCNKHLLLSLNLLLLSCGHLLQLRESELHALISNLNTHMDVVKIMSPWENKSTKSLAETGFKTLIQKTNVLFVKKKQKNQKLSNQESQNVGVLFHINFVISLTARRGRQSLHTSDATAGYTGWLI